MRPAYCQIMTCNPAPPGAKNAFYVKLCSRSHFVCNVLARGSADIACKDLQAFSGRGEGDADGGSGDEDGFALVEGGAVTLGGAAAAFFVEDGLSIGQGAGAGDAHHRKEGVDVREVFRNLVV